MNHLYARSTTYLYLAMSATDHRQGCTTTVKRRQECRLLLALLLTCCGLAAAAAGRRSDADAVADLARSLARPPSTWTTAGGDPCSFEGISCSSSGRVIAIDLAGMGLV